MCNSSRAHFDHMYRAPAKEKTKLHGEAVLQAYYPLADAALREEPDGLLVLAFIPHQLLHALPRPLALHVLDLSIDVRQTKKELETVELVKMRERGGGVASAE